MKKILITGGCGFIGSHLSEFLVEQGYNVKVLDRYNSENSWGWLEKSKYKKDLEVVLGDIRDFDSVHNASKGCNNILHLAALIGIPYSYISPLAYIKTNIEGTYNVLQCSKYLNFENILITSTSEVYGSAIEVPINESHRLLGQSPYSASKIAADQLSLSYFKSFEVPIKIIRPFNTFGPRQSARAIIPSLFSQFYSNKPIYLGNVQTSRDFTYVTDLCNAYLKLLRCNKKKSFGNIYNVGNNKEVSIKDLTSIISKIVGVNKKINLDPKRVRKKNSEVERLKCDYTNFNNLTRWNPKVSFVSGLKKFDDWFKINMSKYKSGQYNV